MPGFSSLIFVLFVVSLIGVTTNARAIAEESNSDALKSYWKLATNNQPLPEALQALVPGELKKDQDGNDHIAKTLKDPNAVYFGYLDLAKHEKGSGSNDEVIDSQKYPNAPKDSVSDQVEYAKLLAFTPSDLYIGKTFFTIFPYVSSPSGFASSFPKFLPRHVADSLPFSTEHDLPNLMRRFGIKSPQSDSFYFETIKKTLKMCEGMSHTGKDAFCATSLESLLDSARKAVGSNYDTNIISTTHLTKPYSTNEGSIQIQTPQKYSLVEAPREIQSPKKLSCHPMTYLYPVFGCHAIRDTKVYRLLLQGEDKTMVDAVAICHMDTSVYQLDAPFLQALGLKPGQGSVCHFMQPSHLSIYASESTGVTAAI